ncbi:MAG TPA: sigma-70 family RNA polymerase sigma factor [Chitinophagaceae bacterium]|nr:sigma-70 family RNA polymerase sigma factor [Chitinophagaceae bacterium]
MEEKSEINQLVDDLFRRETGKMIAVLTRIFGSENVELAEDTVQDALIEAINHWTYKGIPENPTAWLFKVAKNKALNILNREKYKKQHVSDVAHYLQSEWTADPALNYLFSDQEILDDQLRMMFTCCHPSISSDSQIALTLKTLCGFSIPEIAKAFITAEENINKRLVRARQKIRENKIPFEVPQAKDLEKKLNTVLETIYLLFNEGYSASKGNDLIRYELCEEAIRLAEIIETHPAIQDKSNVYSLLSLMQLNASRFKSRQDNEGNILTMAEQDRSLWDYSLIEKGILNLHKSTVSNHVSVYHILAAISGCHCTASDFDSTDWQTILLLYDQLLQLDPSPLVLLNRSVVLSKVKGPQFALEELKRINTNPSLKSYYLFYSTEAEFYINMEEYDKAISSLKRAIELSHLKAEKSLLQKKLDRLQKKA